MTSVSTIVMKRYVNKHTDEKDEFTTKCIVLVARFEDFVRGVIPVAVNKINKMAESGPDSANGRASASGAGGRGFDPGPRHTKGVKMVPVATLLGAQHYKASTGSSLTHD